jgi:CNT family concentrative nucleoside transporter
MTRRHGRTLALLFLILAGATTALAQNAAPPAPAPAAGVPVVERARALGGYVLILAVVYAFSANRRAVSWRTLGGGVALQWALAVFLLTVPAGRTVLEAAERFVEQVLACAIEGSAFVFGPKLTDPAGPAGFVFAFRVLPTIIFVAALFAVLYHLGIMQRVVGACAWVMLRIMRVSGAESLNTAASLFLGQTEAPLTIRPFLPNLTRSELLVVMVSGMALVSGGVLGAYLGAGATARDLLTAILVTAPATIFLSKLYLPETETPETLGSLGAHDERPDLNVLAAASRGTREGLELALNVAAMLIAFLALIALLNGAIGVAGRQFGWEGLTLQELLGRVLAPVAWLMGVPSRDTSHVGALLGTRAITNELIAYGDLGLLKDVLMPRSYTIATIALCGFSNLSSIGIQLGGIGALMPHRRDDLARLGFRAFLISTLANFLSACIAGVLL